MKYALYTLLLLQSAWILDGPDRKLVTLSDWQYNQGCRMYVQIATDRQGFLVKHRFSLFEPVKKKQKR